MAAAARAYEVRPYGWTDLLLVTGDQAATIALYRALQQAEQAYAVDVVCGAGSVLLRSPTDAGRSLAATGSWPDAGPEPALPRVHRIPVAYDGPDLAEAAQACGLSETALIERHTSTTFVVDLTGFAPGFAYCSGWDLRLPRRTNPRPRVPAGSVALAAGYTAVYPAASPGGWQLIGHTTAVMFDPERRLPSLLGPGDEVRFHAV